LSNVNLPFFRVSTAYKLKCSSARRPFCLGMVVFAGVLLNAGKNVYIAQLVG